MNLKINGENTKLKFGVRFCRELDKVYTVDYEGLEFGMGVNLGYMNLMQRNPVALAEVIKAATAHKGFTEDEIDDAIETYAEDQGDLNKLFKQIEDELGNSPTVKVTIEHFQAQAKVEDSKEVH